jgi:NitT/TauT family transport system permease protein
MAPVFERGDTPMPNWIYPTATVVVLIVVWHFAVILFKIPPYLIPAPEIVAKHFVANWQILFYNGAITTYETVGGFVLSILVGVPLAMAIVWSKAVDQALMPLLVLSQTFPKVAIAPLLLIWFGLNITTWMFVSFLVAFFPVVIACVAGMRAVETETMELIRSMRATPMQVFFKIRLPAALPHFFAGLKVAIAFAVVGAVVGEWVGADKGLGHMLIWANANLDTPMVFSVLIALMAIGVVLYYLVVWAERLAIPWHVSVRGEIPQSL